MIFIVVTIFILIDIVIFILFSRLLKQQKIKDAFYLIILMFAFIFAASFFLAEVYPLIEAIIPMKSSSSNTNNSELIGIVLMYLILFSALFFAVKLEIYIKRHQKDLPPEALESLNDNTTQVINNLSNVNILRIGSFIIQMSLIIILIAFFLRLLPKILLFIQSYINNLRFF
jgi:hypothetical protein